MAVGTLIGSQRFNHGEIRRQFHLEQRGVNRPVEHYLGEIVAQAGAVGEFQLGDGNREIVGAKADQNFADEFAGGSALGLERHLQNRVRRRRREQTKAFFHGCPISGKAGIHQGQRVLQRPGRHAFEGIFFRPLEPRIDDEQLVGLAQHDGLRRLAQFPAEPIGHRHPDLAGGHQRLGQHLERPGLGKIAGPALKIGLRGEPAVELDVAFVGAGNHHRQAQHGDGESDENGRWKVGPRCCAAIIPGGAAAPPYPLHQLSLGIGIRQREKSECLKERLYASFGQMGTN